jgi:hypothetical protein
MAAAGPAGPLEDAVLIADADIALVDAMRHTSELDLIRDRRPELYGDLTGGPLRHAGSDRRG